MQENPENMALYINLVPASTHTVEINVQANDVSRIRIVSKAYDTCLVGCRFPFNPFSVPKICLVLRELSRHTLKE